MSPSKPEGEQQRSTAASTETEEGKVDESSTSAMPPDSAAGAASATSDVNVNTASNAANPDPVNTVSSTTTVASNSASGTKEPTKGGTPPSSKTSPSATAQYPPHTIPGKGGPHLPPVPMHHPYAHHHYFAYHQHMAAASAAGNDPKKSAPNKKVSNPVPVPPYNSAHFKNPGTGKESTAKRGKQPPNGAGQPPPLPIYPPPPPHLAGHHHAYQAWAAYQYARQHAQYHGGPPPPPPSGPPPPWNPEAYAAAHQAYTVAISKEDAARAKGGKSKGSPTEKGSATSSASAVSMIPQPPPPMYPPPPPGPYRFSDYTLRKEAVARSVAEGLAKRKNATPTNVSSKTNSPPTSIPPHASISGGPSTPASSVPKNPTVVGSMVVGGTHKQPSPQDTATLHMLELEARAEGATSPSQIEDFHKEEVATMGCTCKKTKCLKLYCQCFAVKIYCGPNCRCLSCFNNVEHETERQNAIRGILARNPTAFDTKFQKNNRKVGPGIMGPGGIMAGAANGGIGGRAGPGGMLGTMDIPHQRTISHKVGCKCRKSACMKKYCECYASNVKCSSTCRCVGCKNMPLGGFGPHPGAAGAAVISEPAMATTSKRTPTKAVMTTPVKKEPSWMMDAAQNLAFLKHGSAEKPRRIISRAPSESGSMPSLASSSEESPVSGTNKTKGNVGGTRRVSNPSTAEREAVNALKSSEKTAVNALLMAAWAMTEMSSVEQQNGNDKNENRHDSATTNDSNGESTEGAKSPNDNRDENGSPEATTRVSDDHFETPQRNLFKKFMSPKRKIGDRNAEKGTPSSRTHTVPLQSPSRDLGSSEALTESDYDEDSPKREHPGHATPSMLQKVKRSRLGSLRKGAKRLDKEKHDDQCIIQTASKVLSEVAPMEMSTPAKDGTGNIKLADLTPVSARCIDFKKMRVNDSSSDPAIV